MKRMKKRILFLVSNLIIAFSSACSTNRVFEYTQVSYGQSLPELECIEYSKLSYVDLCHGKFNVDVGVAHLTSEGENPKTKISSINISLKEEDGKEIKSYDVNINDYKSYKNAVLYKKLDVFCLFYKFALKKSDFGLVYSFNLFELLPNTYNGKIFFAVKYQGMEYSKTDGPAYRYFSFHYVRNSGVCKLLNYSTSIENI